MRGWSTPPDASEGADVAVEGECLLKGTPPGLPSECELHLIGGQVGEVDAVPLKRLLRVELKLEPCRVVDVGLPHCG